MPIKSMPITSKPIRIIHPIFFPTYKSKSHIAADNNGVLAKTPITFFIVEACYPIRFGQSMTLGYLGLFLGCVAVLVLLGWYYAVPVLLLLAHWLAYFLMIGNDEVVRRNNPYELPLPFLGRLSKCQARPLATLYTDGIKWHINPLNLLNTNIDDDLKNDLTSGLKGGLTKTNCANHLSQVFKNTMFVYLPPVGQTWHFKLNAPNGIHRLDVSDKLVVYFADVLSLDGTPCCFDGAETLLIRTDNSYQRLTFVQFCQWVNDRAYNFRKNDDRSNEKTNHSP